MGNCNLPPPPHPHTQHTTAISNFEMDHVQEPGPGMGGGGKQDGVFPPYPAIHSLPSSQKSPWTLFQPALTAQGGQLVEERLPEQTDIRTDTHTHTPPHTQHRAIMGLLFTLGEAKRGLLQKTDCWGLLVLLQWGNGGRGVTAICRRVYMLNIFVGGFLLNCITKHKCQNNFRKYNFLVFFTFLM